MLVDVWKIYLGGKDEWYNVYFAIYFSVFSCVERIRVNFAMGHFNYDVSDVVLLWK